MAPIHQSTFFLLATFATLAIGAGILYQSGLLGWMLDRGGRILFAIAEAGFRAWRTLFSWAPWPLLVLIVAGLHVLAFYQEEAGAITALCGLALLAVGVVSCLAYVYVDLERYDVGRGYKVLVSPAKGQEVAVHLAAHGHQLGIPTLVTATLATISGFALLNQGLYATIGTSWYALDEVRRAATDVQDGPHYADFLAYTLIHLFRLVDLLDIAHTYDYAHLTFVRQARWPASTLVMIFKTFFSFVLLQQVFSAIRTFKLLGDTVKDFWSPHAPVHQRAAGALGQYGAAAVKPLLESLRPVEVVTADQRVEIPHLLAELGPTTIPILVKHLRDPNENVRATVINALGQLHALEALQYLEIATKDPSEWARQALVEALQVLCSSGTHALHKKWSLRVALVRSRAWAYWWWRWRKGGHDRRTDYPVRMAVKMLRVLLQDASAQVRAKAIATLMALGPAAQAAAPELCQRLHDEDESVRCHAIEALGKIGLAGPAVPALVPLLEDASAAVRAAAARALGAFRAEASAAVPTLIPLLQDREATVRQAAAEALAATGAVEDAVLAELTAGLASADNVVRAQTAEALGTIGATAAATAPALMDALEDPNDQVRAKAVEALGKMGATAADAIPSLIERLRDEDNNVSALAAEALAEMGPVAADAAPALIAALGHVNPQVRGNVAAALGKLAVASEAVLQALRHSARDEDAPVRGEALGALAELTARSPSLEPTLLEGLEDADPQVRARAVQAVALAGGGNAGVLEALLKRLRDPNDRVKVEVLKALPGLTDDAHLVLADLCDALHDDTLDVQLHAARALGQLGASAAAAGDALVRAFQTADVSVREEVLRALVQIQPPQAVAAFLAGLQDTNSELRILAVAGLLKAGPLPPEAEPILIDALRDPESRVRSTAAQVFVRLGAVPEAAVAYLVECTGHTDDGVRLNAARALNLAATAGLNATMERLLEDSKSSLRLLAAQHLLAANPNHRQAAQVFADALADPSSHLRKQALTELELLGPHAVQFLAILKKHRPNEDDEQLALLMDELIFKLEATTPEEEVAAAGLVAPGAATAEINDEPQRPIESTVVQSVDPGYQESVSDEMVQGTGK